MFINKLTCNRKVVFSSWYGIENHDLHEWLGKTKQKESTQLAHKLGTILVSNGSLRSVVILILI